MDAASISMTQSNAESSGHDDDSESNLNQSNLFDHVLILRPCTVETEFYVTHPYLAFIRDQVLKVLTNPPIPCEFVVNWENVPIAQSTDAARLLVEGVDLLAFLNIGMNEVATNLPFSEGTIYLQPNGSSIKVWDTRLVGAVVSVFNSELSLVVHIKLSLIGIELNPGPPGKPSTAPSAPQAYFDRRAAKQAKKAKKNFDHAKAATADAIMLSALETKAKEQAKEDVAAENAEEQRLLKEEEERVRIKASLMADATILKLIDFELVSAAKDFEPQVGKVSTFEPRLTPVQVACCTLTDVIIERESKYTVFNTVNVKGKKSVNLKYSSEIKSFGIMGKEISVRPGPDMMINLDMFRLFQAKQMATCISYCMILDRLEAYIPSHLSFHHDEYSGYWFTEYSNRLFVACLKRQAVPQLDVVNVIKQALLYDVKGLSSGDGFIRSYLSKTVPADSGTYVQGYECGLAELFPDILTDVALYGKEKALSMVSSGSAFVAKSKDSIEKMKLKAMTYARLCEGCHIKDFLPPFPDPCLPSNILGGVIKRLICARPSVSEKSLFYWHLIGDVLSERAEKCRVDTLSTKEIRAEGLLRAKSEPWTEAQRNEYCLGVERVIQIIEGSPIDDRDVSALDEFSWFIKQETYPAQQRKAVRLIVCPDHFVRGMLWAALHKSEEAIKMSLEGHLVKGLNKDQVLRRVTDLFTGQDNIIEGDTTSFERHVSSERQIRCEVPIYTNAAPIALQPLVGAMMRRFAANNPILTGGYGTIFAEVMRLSGTQQTSIGNAIENICMWFSMLCDVEDIPAVRVADYFDQYPLPYVVEGDDILLAVREGFPMDKFERVAKSHGNQLKAECFSSFLDANFCGNTIELVTESGGIVPYRLKEPLEALSRVFTRLGVYGTDAKNDIKMLVAKCRSYLIDFPGTPILSEICQSVLNKFGNIDAELRREIQAYLLGERVKISAIAREFYQSHKYNLPQLKLFLSGEVEGFAHVAESMRVRVQEYFGLSLTFQNRVVAEFRAGLLAGDSEINVPTLTTYWQTLPGVAGMTARRLEGVADRMRTGVVRARADTIEILSGKLPDMIMGKNAVVKTIEKVGVITDFALILIGLFVPSVAGILMLALLGLSILLACVAVVFGTRWRTALRVVLALWLTSLVVLIWPVVKGVVRLIFSVRHLQAVLTRAMNGESYCFDLIARVIKQVFSQIAVFFRVFPRQSGVMVDERDE